MFFGYLEPFDDLFLKVNQNKAELGTNRMVIMIWVPGIKTKNPGYRGIARWWQLQILFLILHPYRFVGDFMMIQFDLRIFFKWVGEKHHQLDSHDVPIGRAGLEIYSPFGVQEFELSIKLGGGERFFPPKSLVRWNPNPLRNYCCWETSGVKINHLSSMKNRIFEK